MNIIKFRYIASRHPAFDHLYLWYMSIRHAYQRRAAELNARRKYGKDYLKVIENEPTWNSEQRAAKEKRLKENRDAIKEIDRQLAEEREVLVLTQNKICREAGIVRDNIQRQDRVRNLPFTVRGAEKTYTRHVFKTNRLIGSIHDLLSDRSLCAGEVLCHRANILLQDVAGQIGFRDERLSFKTFIVDNKLGIDVLLSGKRIFSTEGPLPTTLIIEEAIKNNTPNPDMSIWMRLIQ